MSILTFFGLTPNYKPLIHTQIFDIVYYGNGGFNWNDVYNMPVWLRKFYIKKIEEALKAKKKAEEDATKKSTNTKSIPKPSFAKKR